MVRGTGIGFILKYFYFVLEKPVRVKLTQQFVRTLQIPLHFFSLDCLWTIINVNLSWITVIYPSWLYTESADLESALASFLANHSCFTCWRKEWAHPVGLLSSSTWPRSGFHMCCCSHGCAWDQGKRHVLDFKMPDHLSMSQYWVRVKLLV